MEIHNYFSITELTEYEDLQGFPRRQAAEKVDPGFFSLDGEIPNQPDGALKSSAHSIGASGLRMMYEIYKQLQGKAGQRQIRNPKLGLPHNMGRSPPLSVISISIVGR